MPNLIVKTRDGQEHELTAAAGGSVMQVIRDNNIDELLAMCGGSCACATCHVYIDADWTERVGEANASEDELLDSSAYRKPQSRLSCQIKFLPELNGLSVQIAPED